MNREVPDRGSSAASRHMGPVDGEIERGLRNYLIENCLPQGMKMEHGNEENLFDTGILDSAALVSFVCFIEKEFSLTIPDEDLLPEHFTSIASISKYIRSKRDTLAASQQA